MFGSAYKPKIRCLRQTESSFPVSYRLNLDCRPQRMCTDEAKRFTMCYFGIMRVTSGQSCRTVNISSRNTEWRIRRGPHKFRTPKISVNFATEVPLAATALEEIQFQFSPLLFIYLFIYLFI